jgi:hypothetical protein
MPPRPKPKLAGAELAFFDVLVALHVKYLAQRAAIFDVALGQGVSPLRISEISRLVLIYTTPAECVDRFEQTVAMLEDEAYRVMHEKPS